MEVGGQSFVDLKDLLSIPNHPLKIARQDNARLAHGENTANVLTIALQLLPLFLELCERRSGKGGRFGCCKGGGELMY